MSRLRQFVVTLSLLGGCALIGLAEPPARTSEVRPTRSQSALTVDNTTYINANDIFMFVTNHGNFGRDLDGVFGNGFGTYYPYLSTEYLQAGACRLSVLYAAGLWIGGIDSVTHDTLVTVSEYSSEYVPGPMLAGSFQPDRPEFRVYKLHRDSLESNPNQDYLEWPVDQGAPVDGEGHPAIRGDQMLWTVYNDANPDQHNNSSGKTEPIKVEIQQTVWSYGDNSGDWPPPIEAQHVGPGEGSVRVYPARPSFLTGHDYMVIFVTDSHPKETWSLIDVTTDETVLEGVVDRSGVAASPVVDGMQVVVEDPGHRGVMDWAIPNGTRRFTWANAYFGWEGFGGALGWGGPADYFGGYDPVPHESLVRVLLKLAASDADGNFDVNDPNVSYAYRYLRNANNPPAQPEFAPFIISPGSGYRFQPFERSCPLSAWNIDVDPPQRLAVGYLENNRTFGLVDGKYWPPESDWLLANLTSNTNSEGPREWLWIFLDDYSETPNPAYQGDAMSDPMPIMYWATWARRGTDVIFEDGDEFLIIPGEGYSLTQADTFYFQTPPPFAGPPPEPDDLSIYLSYKLINKGGRFLKDCFVSLWLDPDLGTAGDDLVGCDTLNNSFFCYNSEDFDRYYGDAPPAVGFKVLEGPIIFSPGDTAVVDRLPRPNYKNLGMYSFNQFVGGNDPDNYAESYCLMRGLNAKNGCIPFINPTTSQPTRYQHSGDPVAGTGWVDEYPDDRRMMASFGPFDFRPGDTQQVLFKTAVGQGTDNLSSITSLRQVLEYDEDITDVDDNNPVTLPRDFAVCQNYPNPFNPATTINYSLPEKADVEVTVFNVLGQKVATLISGTQSAGEHTAVWNGKDNSGKDVSSGVYFYRVRAGDAVQARKMLLLK